MEKKSDTQISSEELEDLGLESKDPVIIDKSMMGLDGKPRIYRKTAPTINATQPHLINTMKIRRLTPIECERLQGFPDGWTEGVSDTQRYKQMGNAVTVNVIEAIAGRLLF